MNDKRSQKHGEISDDKKTGEKIINEKKKN